ncbi:hypothetical protein [Rhizobium sp. 9140]|uniref:hypothetical protein n=1 Tax=Rhizobium sp. 9140 TaxID=1761900 RepID=UPI0007921D22|nr:hypothetical protein [Rhizobium sp. 9140]CZT33348.1 hypothetical protein GA0004734_00003730 [Rhizobium sp. 9140]
MVRDVSLRSVAVAIGLVVFSFGSAEAGDEGFRGLYSSAQQEQREQRSGVRLQGRPYVVPDYRAIPDYRVVRGVFDGERRGRRGWRAPAAVIVGSGRYSGNANGLYRSHAGSYFTITNYDEDTSYGAIERYPAESRAVRSRVITVDRGAARRNDSACSFEAGVCVIRGR